MKLKDNSGTFIHTQKADSLISTPVYVDSLLKIEGLTQTQAPAGGVRIILHALRRKS